MPLNRILKSTSPGALDADSRQMMYGLFDETYQRGQKKALDTRAIFDTRHALTASLSFYDARVEDINPALFPYLKPSEAKALEEELLFAFTLFSSQYHLDEVFQRRQCLQERSEKIKHCANLISKLRKSSQKETPKSMLDSAIEQSEKHAKYLGLKVAPVVAGMLLNLTTDADAWAGAGQMAQIKKGMGGINLWRLYWVWAGSHTRAWVDLLPDDFYHKQQAAIGLAMPSPITGYMSWLLYYARFGINLSLLLKHTLVGPWMSVPEKNLFSGEKYPTWARFKTQWDQRKFTLLNDSIWATANLACFFWLVGDGLLGYFGNIATTVLLLMDTCISVWNYCEEETQHELYLERLEKDISTCQANLQNSLDDGERFQLELQTLMKAKRQCNFDWRYKTYALQNDMVYAVGLMVAFAVMCGVLCPPSVLLPATAVLLGVVGSGLCFVFSIITAGVSAGIDLAKVRESKANMHEEGQALLKVFVGTSDEAVKKRLYLEMKQVLAKTDDQAKQIQYQERVLMRDMMLKVMIPPLLFVALVFMPLGVGLGVIAIGLAMAFVSHRLIENSKPEKSAKAAMNDADYERFSSLKPPTLEDLNPAHESIKRRERGVFFQKKCDDTNVLPKLGEPIPKS